MKRKVQIVSKHLLFSSQLKIENLSGKKYHVLIKEMKIILNVSDKNDQYQWYEIALVFQTFKS